MSNIFLHLSTKQIHSVVSHEIFTTFIRDVMDDILLTGPFDTMSLLKY
jgi:hypothetical protein